MPLPPLTATPVPVVCPYCPVSHDARVPCAEYLALHRLATQLPVPPPPDVDALVAQAVELLTTAHRVALSTSAGRNIDLIEDARESCLRWLTEE